ncbi:mitogen-activated protein kinase 4 isoform X3 [Daphnia magna]|uniref:mitogen-activated protein kinase 4 isoform X3 n=1 Tax=Daphnia magna TaxID=35525 RepID=UPI001E1BB280|nr:mitogen-activated protein kinase 4 isoform X3 [Daphnia magna]
MSSNLVKDPDTSSSRTERNETPATLQEETLQTNAPNETTSSADVMPFSQEHKMSSSVADDSGSIATTISQNTPGRSTEENVSSRAEQEERAVASGGEAPLTNAPIDGGREPVREGSKLFRVKTGISVGQYRCLPEYPQEKQKKKKKRDFYKGFYNCDIPVAIVKTLIPIDSDPTELQKEGKKKEKIKNARKESEREFRILKELEVHENFIRYFGREVDQKQEFVYLATELCLCSVEDLLDPALEKEISMKKEILDELQAKEILRQATRGLNYLHQNNFIHRNIKPNNFLIQEVNKTGGSSCRFVVKITDFRLTRKRDPSTREYLSGSAASQGWEAPESRDQKKELSTKLDVFILGCFYHYVMIALSKKVNKGKPRHPFGDSELLRPENITNTNYSVYEGKLPFVPNSKNEGEKQVAKLITSMLKFNEDDRPTLQQVLENKYFKPTENYKIYDHVKTGLCVIFNQQEFENPKEVREGSEMDRDMLMNTFHKLGFEIEKKESLDSFELKSEINNLAERDFKDYGCLVVCLLSHGIENAIQCYDRRCVNTNELKYEFSLDNCPSLYGKPKIFIVQACQGSLSQSETGIVAPPANPASFFSKLILAPVILYQHFTGGLESSPSTVQLRNKDVKHTYSAEQLKEMKILDDARRNPPLMDFITIKATLPGFLCYRNKKKGSRFIRSLCKALSQEYLDKIPDEGTQHLEDLLRCVQVEINAYSEKYYWQTMTWEVCLSKHIRFRKGVTEGKDVELR